MTCTFWMEILCSIYQKGHKQVCNNYGDIALFSFIYKILWNCILDTIRPWAEELLSDYQAGFRNNIYTINKICIFKIILQIMLEYEKVLHFLFVDFKKVYNFIYRKSLVSILEQIGLSLQIANLIKSSIMNKEKI